MFDVAEIMCPKDTRNLARLPRMQEIYAALWKVANRHKPETIFEIGVRAGYSAYTLITGSGVAREYTGWDVDDRERYGGPWMWWAQKLLDGLRETYGLDYDMWLADSQEADNLPGTFDLIHVDGDHTYEGCLHDMEICWPAVNPGGVMVVDDATYLPGPRKACEDWACDGMAEMYLEPSPTGSMVYVKA